MVVIFLNNYNALAVYESGRQKLAAVKMQGEKVGGKYIYYMKRKD